jgi:hypothetical protein
LSPGQNPNLRFGGSKALIPRSEDARAHLDLDLPCQGFL